MKIAYLMNSYPMVSTTFIGREIAALEVRGFEVARYAIRRWSGELVDDLDRREAEITSYLLENGAAALFKGLAAEAARNPKGMAAALKLWWALVANAGGGPVRHVAYLLEAVALRRRLRAAPVAHLHAHWSTNTAAVAMLCAAMGGPAYSFTIHGQDELFEPAIRRHSQERTSTDRTTLRRRAPRERHGSASTTTTDRFASSLGRQSIDVLAPPSPNVREPGLKTSRYGLALGPCSAS